MVRGDECFENHNPAVACCALQQRVCQMWDADVQLIGAVDQVWRTQSVKCEQERSNSGWKQKQVRGQEVGCAGFSTLSARCNPSCSFTAAASDKTAIHILWELASYTESMKWGNNHNNWSHIDCCTHCDCNSTQIYTETIVLIKVCKDGWIRTIAAVPSPTFEAVVQLSTSFFK